MAVAVSVLYPTEGARARELAVPGGFYAVGRCFSLQVLAEQLYVGVVVAPCR